MARKSKVGMKADSAAKTEPRTITVEAVMRAISAGAHSPTAIAKALGFKSGSSSVIRRLKAAVPDLEGILAMCHEASDSKAAKGKSAGKSGVTAAGTPAVAGKWGRHAANPFRVGSYGTCFDILAAHPEGLPRETLVGLLAQATSKDIQHAAYDVQVVCSAHGAAGEGLNPFEGPRNRSCRFGFWVERKGDNVRLVLPAGTPKPKGRP